MKNLTMRQASALLTVLICAFLTTSVTVEAQVTGFPGKFVCGYELGNVPLLNDPDPLTPPKKYENFKPGNYATSINVLNLNPTPQSVSFILTLQNLPPVNVFTLVINPFTSLDVGCEEIFNPFIPPLVGQLFEGYVTTVTNNANFIVNHIITYLAQNAFERHLAYEDGQATWTLGRTLDDILVNFNPPAGFFVQAASGAGGLGLGASIEVESIDAVALDSTILDIATDVFPIDDLANPGATEEPVGVGE